MAEKVLEIRGLCKDYPAFHLKDVSFSLERGRIMGFIGRNGAGKTTTLKSALNIVHPAAGELKYFGLDFAENELEIKRRIAFVSGGANYYPNKKLAAITAVTRNFYEHWDEAAYRRYTDEGEALLASYKLLQSRDEADYEKYLQRLKAWQSERDAAVRAAVARVH